MAEGTAPATQWWHYFLLYPTLLLSLGGALPTVWREFQAWKLGVDSARLQIIQEQQQLWEKNLACLRLRPVYTISLDTDVEVAVTLCTSGDALLRYQRSSQVVSYTWVKYPAHRPAPEPQHSSQGDQAPATTRITYGATRCLLQQAHIVLWVLDANGAGCRLEYISTIRGVLLRREAVACTFCAPL